MRTVISTQALHLYQGVTLLRSKRASISRPPPRLRSSRRTVTTKPMAVNSWHKQRIINSIRTRGLSMSTNSESPTLSERVICRLLWHFLIWLITKAPSQTHRSRSMRRRRPFLFMRLHHHPTAPNTSMGTKSISCLLPRTMSKSQTFSTASPSTMGD